MAEINNNMNPQVEICNEEEIKNLKLNKEYDKVLKLMYPNLIFYIGCSENVVRILQQSKVNPDGKLINISLPDTIEYMGEHYTINQLDAAVFNDCNFFDHIKLPNFITTIERYSFESATIGELILPNHLECIEPAAFRYCYLNNLEIPESVIHIGEHAWTQAEIKEIWFKNEQSIENDFEEDTEWLIDEELDEWLESNGVVYDDDTVEGLEHYINWYGLSTIDDDDYEIHKRAFYEEHWTIPSETKIYVGKNKKEIENPEK